MRCFYLRCGIAAAVPAFLAVAASAFLLVGCGGGGGSSPAAPITATGQYGPLQLSLTAQSSYARGQQVAFTFAVNNTSGQAALIAIGPGPDFTISRNGQLVYQNSQRYGTIGGYNTLSFAPGPVVSNNLTWDQTDLQGHQVSPGQYTLKVWSRIAAVNKTIVDDPESQLAAAPVALTIR